MQPVETKVAASTATATVLAVITAVLTASQDVHVLGSTPLWFQTLALLIIPPLLTFLAGYQAPHTPRENPVTENPAYEKTGESDPQRQQEQGQEPTQTVNPQTGQVEPVDGEDETPETQQR